MSNLSVGRERVSVRDGILPIIFVAAHGTDDPNTDIIASMAAEQLDCYAVMNCGWERADKVDISNDKANCNSIAHCHEDVIKDEFLDPILRYAHRSIKLIQWGKDATIPFLAQPLMISVHGAGDNARIIAKNNSLDFILGVGNGTPNRHTCANWRKNAFAWALVNKGVNVWEGKAGGTYAAWGKDNLSQLFVTKYPLGIHTIQIEIVRQPWRKDEKKARATGFIIAEAIKNVLKQKDFSQFQGDLGLPKV